MYYRGLVFNRGTNESQLPTLTTKLSLFLVRFNFLTQILALGSDEQVWVELWASKTGAKFVSVCFCGKLQRWP